MAAFYEPGVGRMVSGITMVSSSSRGNVEWVGTGSMLELLESDGGAWSCDVGASSADLQGSTQ